MFTYLTLALMCVAYASARMGGCGGCVREMTQQEMMNAKDMLAGLDLEVELLNKRRENDFRIVRHSMIKATQQVVEGWLYRVQLRLVESQCKNTEENDGKSIAECPAKADKRTMTCVVSVWSRPWVKAPMKKLVTRMKCLRL